MPAPAAPPALTSARPVVFTAGAVSSTRALGKSSSLPYAASASMATPRLRRRAPKAPQTTGARLLVQKLAVAAQMRTQR
jgi:hypothetical protein